MPTYYGVWSGHWWSCKLVVFHTASLALARAQAMIVNDYCKGLYGEEMFTKRPPWKAREIGEDGLPVKEE